MYISTDPYDGSVDADNPMAPAPKPLAAISGAHRRARLILLSLAFLVLLPNVPVEAQLIRPLSRLWYRLPYADATSIENPGNDLFQDVPPHNGYDIKGLPLKAWDDASPHQIVAMADGVVIEVVDGFNQCGLFPDSTGYGVYCNNYIWIDHLNGEYSSYWHIAYQSAQVDSGDVVSAGDWIAWEGDVGSTGSDDATYNRPKQGCDGTEDHAGDEFPLCGMHLHFSVTTMRNYEQDPLLALHPRICGVATHAIIKNDPNSTCVSCSAASCVADSTISRSWNGELNALVVSNTLQTSGSVVITNSVVGFQAGNSVTLTAGFKAVSGSYFRAEIGPCEGQ